jgi:uncharacterized RmlC-like cupin family protein
MSQDSANPEAPACAVVRSGVPFIGKQGLSYAPGISAETVGSKAIHLDIITIPPGGRAKAHKHDSHETAIYVISGEATTYFGERLENQLIARAGDFMYIAPNVPHQPHNASSTEPCIAVVARTDPNEQESVVMLPELDAAHP